MDEMKISKRLPKMVLIATLVVNIILTVINVYLVVQVDQALTDLESREKTLDSTFAILAKADKVVLGKPSAYFMDGDVLRYTIHFGELYLSVHAIMPHYGVVAVKLKSFNVTGSKYIDTDRLREIEISYVDEPQSYVYVLAPGLNQINSKIRLKAKIPVNPENFPSEGESIQFSLGYLFLEAEALDFENRNKISSEFSSEILVIMELT